MKLETPIPFIVLGGRVRYLLSRDVGNKISGEHLVLSNLEKLGDDLDKQNLKVSKNLYESTLNKLKGELKTLSKSNEQATLTEKQNEILQEAMSQLEKTIYAEAKTRPIVSPTPRRF